VADCLGVADYPEAAAAVVCSSKKSCPISARPRG